MKDTTPDSVREDFIEKIGLITQTDGMPRIAGRVFGLFLFDGGVVSFGDLAEQLLVSRGSISTATRILEERGLIKRVGKAGQRQDFFQLVENPYPDMLETIVSGLEKSKTEVDDTIALLGSDRDDTRQRLNQYAGFYKAVLKSTRAAIETLKT